MSAIGLEGFFRNTKKRYGIMLVVVFQKKGQGTRGLKFTLTEGWFDPDLFHE
jgi:hypothetical protein